MDKYFYLQNLGIIEIQIKILKEVKLLRLPLLFKIHNFNKFLTQIFGPVKEYIIFGNSYLARKLRNILPMKNRNVCLTCFNAF